jgi:hypothetical protein
MRGGQQIRRQGRMEMAPVGDELVQLSMAGERLLLGEKAAAPWLF